MQRHILSVGLNTSREMSGCPRAAFAPVIEAGGGHVGVTDPLLDLCDVGLVRQRVRGRRRSHGVHTQPVHLDIDAGFRWQQDGLEDFVSFYYSGVHRADDAFSKVELKYMANNEDNAQPDDFAVRVQRGLKRPLAEDVPNPIVLGLFRWASSAIKRDYDVLRMPPRGSGEDGLDSVHVMRGSNSWSLRKAWRIFLFFCCVPNAPLRRRYRQRLVCSSRLEA